MLGALAAVDELPESHCGFRKGMQRMQGHVFCEAVNGKFMGTQGELFITFVGLKKVYDLILRRALWTILRKLGVPEVMVSLIQSFY